MATPPSSPGSVDGTQFSSSHPLRGVVICCTSIPPDLRTEIAKKATELGGTHKYDLTPDCTHLIVGDYNTPKYRHVAKDRPDVKAMAAGWIEAVRNLWIADLDIDFDALEAEWQLKTFEASGGESTTASTLDAERRPLLCCMTGFEDPDVRQEIQSKIEANGGVYTGDLTKRVTHLVVYKAEGRKYQAAKNWGVHTVSIEWVNDCVERGMILDEKCYDPILTKEQRGVGAWNRKEVKRVALGGKRPRTDSVAAADEGKRKLRKVASMKLNTQRDNLWGDILGNNKPAESEPVAPVAPQGNVPHATIPTQPAPTPSFSAAGRSMDTQGTRLSSFGAPQDGMVFASCGFYVHGFSEQKTAVVVNAVSSLGGLVCDSAEEVTGASGAQLTHRFIVVPQEAPPETHADFPDNVHIITQFYIERCMHKKYFFNPADHVLGRPFPVFPIPGFENLTICTAGFTGVDLNHIDKALRQLGAKYEERFTADVSLLICPSLAIVRPEKLSLAVTFKVPVVSSDWLWESITLGYVVPIEPYLYPDLKQNLTAPKPTRSQKPGPDAPKGPSKRTGLEGIDADLVPKPAANPRPRRQMDSSGFSAASNTATTSKPPPKRRPSNPRPDADDSMTTTTHFDTALTHLPNTTTNDTPLSETTLSTLNRVASPQKKKPSIRPRIPFEVPDSDDSDDDDPASSAIPPPAAAPEPEPEDPAVVRRRLAEEKAAERLEISDKLFSSLLGGGGGGPGPAREPSPDPAAAMTTRPRRKREVLGRAISNVSSAGSSTGGATESMKVVPEAEAEAPSGTQIGYEDPEAKKLKGRLLNKIGGRRASAGGAVEEE
ncbi:S-M checkpoint control protein rad4 [Podospora conica]|nr:S-M checkpoint control protein rad4 [Schizothecium conicum]